MSSFFKHWIVFVTLHCVSAYANNATGYPQAVCLSGTIYNLIAGRYDIGGYLYSQPYYVKRHSSDEGSTPIYLYVYNDKYHLSDSFNDTYCYYYCPSSNISQCTERYPFIDCGDETNATELSLDVHCRNYSTNCLSDFDTFSYNTSSPLCVSSTSCHTKWGIFMASYQFMGCHSGYPYYKSLIEGTPQYIWHNVGSHHFENVSFCLADDMNVNTAYCSVMCSISSTDILECSDHWMNSDNELVNVTVHTDCDQQYTQLDITNDTINEAICITAPYNIIEGRYDLKGYQFCRPYYLKRHSDDTDSNALYLYIYNGKYQIGTDISSSTCYFYCESSRINECSEAFVSCSTKANITEITLADCADYSTNCISYFDDYAYNINTSLCMHSSPCCKEWCPFIGSYQFEGCHAGYPYFKAVTGDVPRYIWHNSGSNVGTFAFCLDHDNNTNLCTLSYCLDDDINMNTGFCMAFCHINSTDITHCSGNWFDVVNDVSFNYIIDSECDDTEYITYYSNSTNSVCISGVTYNNLVGRYDFVGNYKCKPYYVKRHSDIYYLYVYNDKYYIGDELGGNAYYGYCSSNNISHCSQPFMWYDSNGVIEHMALEINCANYSTNCVSYFDEYMYTVNTSLCLFSAPWIGFFPIFASYRFEGCHENYPYYKATTDDADIPQYIWHNVGSHDMAQITYCIDSDMNMNSGICKAFCTVNSTDVLQCSDSWFNQYYQQIGYIIDVCCEDPHYTTYHPNAKIYDEFCIWGFEEDDIAPSVSYGYRFWPINGKYVYGGCTFYGWNSQILASPSITWEIVVNKAYYINSNQKSGYGTDIILYYKQYDVFEWGGNGRYVIMSEGDENVYALCNSDFNYTYTNDEDIIAKCQNQNWVIFPHTTHYPQLTIGSCCRDNMYFNSSFCVTGSSLTIQGEDGYSFNINGYFKYFGCLENEPYWKTSFVRYPFIGKQTLYMTYITAESVYCLYTVATVNITQTECFAICEKYDLFECKQNMQYDGVNISDFNIIISDECTQNHCVEQMRLNEAYAYNLYSTSFIEDESLCFFVNNYIASNVQVDGFYLPPSSTFEYGGCANDYPFWIDSNNSLYIFHVYDEKDVLCLSNHFDFKTINISNLYQHCYAICNSPNVFDCQWKLYLFGNFNNIGDDIYFNIGDDHCKPTAIPCEYGDYIDRDYCIEGREEINGEYRYQYCYNGWPLFTQKQNEDIILQRHNVESTQWDIVYNNDVIAYCEHEYLPLCTSTQWHFAAVDDELQFDLFASFCSEWKEFERLYDDIESLGTYKVNNTATIIGWILFAILSLILILICVKDIYIFYKNKKINESASRSRSEIELSQRFTGTTDIDGAAQITKSNDTKLEKKVANKYILFLKNAWKSKYRIYIHFIIKIGFDIYDLMTDILLSKLWTEGRFTDDVSSQGAFCKIMELVSLGNALLYISIIGFSLGVIGRVIEVTKCFCLKPQALNVYITSLQIGKVFIEDIGSLIICWLSLLTTPVNAGIGFYWYQSFYTSCASITFTLIRIKKEVLSALWIRISQICGFCLIIFSIGILNGFESLTSADINYAVIVDEQCVMYDMNIAINYNMSNSTTNATTNANADFVGTAARIPMLNYDNDRYSLECGIQSHTRIPFDSGYFDDYAVLSCVVNDSMYHYQCNMFVEMGDCYSGGCWMGFNDTKICMIELRFE